MKLTARADFSTIAGWIAPSARVLDLGCGDGSLFAYLRESRGVTGYGIEIDDAGVLASIGNGVNVIQSDLESGLAGFDEQSGAFEIALRKTAVAIPAPQCRMEFLILKIPFYHHDTPKQATVSERRAIYDSFVAFQAGGSGRLTARVEAPLGLARRGRSGVELAACNLLFAFPLSVQVLPR